MYRWSIVAAAVAIVLISSDAWAKRARPETQPATLPSTQPSTKDVVEVGKTRARTFEQGKDLDKTKTSSKLDTMLGQVGALDQKLRTTTPPPAEPAVRRRPRTTQPATLPTKTVEKNTGDK